MPLSEEDAEMSMLARTRFFLIKFFLLLISRGLNDRERDRSATEGDSQVPDCPLNHVSSYTNIYGTLPLLLIARGVGVLLVVLT